jgi:hypothetical protein
MITHERAARFWQKVDKWYGGESGLEEYQEDPDASVSSRITVRADFVGRVA